MKISNYVTRLMKDILVAYGVLMIIVAIFLAIYSVETISVSLLL